MIRNRPPPITEPAITAVRSLAPVVVVEDSLMTVGIKLKDVMVDPPTTVTKDEVMVDVVWCAYVEAGVVDVGLF